MGDDLFEDICKKYPYRKPLKNSLPHFGRKQMNSICKKKRRNFVISYMSTEQTAVEILNSLQSNESILGKSRLQKNRQAITNAPFTEKYLATSSRNIT